MNIQTFSQTYWYIWFLVILAIVIILLINGGGILYFRKRRKQFLRQSNKINNRNGMHETSYDRINRKPTISIINSEYQHISTPFTLTTDDRLSHFTKSEPLVTPSIDFKENVQSTLSFNQYIEKTGTDFQQQALEEHNLFRAQHNKPPLKLSEALNINAQYWADQCAHTNITVPSRTEWRLLYQGQPIGENIISTKITNQFDGIQFTRMIIANGDQSKEVHCLLNEVSTEVGFGFAQSKLQDNTQQQSIGVAHYYPYRQLTTIQS